MYIYIHDMLLKPKRKRDLTVYPVKGDMQSYATEATIESLYDTWIFNVRSLFYWVGFGLEWETAARWVSVSWLPLWNRRLHLPAN